MLPDACGYRSLVRDFRWDAPGDGVAILLPHAAEAAIAHIAA